MRVRRFAGPAEFLAEIGPRVTGREAFFNLPLTVAGTCVADPARYPGPNYFAVVEDGGGGGAPAFAAMTPPHPLQTFVPPGPGVKALADDLADGLEDGRWTVAGVLGPTEFADAFAEAWRRLRGLRAVTKMNLRAFELTSVVPPPAPAGRMRAAADADLDFVVEAYREFERESHGSSSPAVGAGARRALRDGRVFLWDDGRPVAQAAVAGRTPNGVRIGAVWTPPAQRRRGYATALVAALSQRALDEGARSCFLFTDLANPVSNSIYPKVGYRPIGDFRELAFG